MTVKMARLFINSSRPESNNSTKIMQNVLTYIAYTKTDVSVVLTVYSVSNY